MKSLHIVLLSLAALGGCDASKGTWSCYNEETNTDSQFNIFSATAILLTFNLDSEVYQIKQGDTYLKNMEGATVEEHLEIARKLEESEASAKLVAIAINEEFLEFQTEAYQMSFKLNRKKPNSDEARLVAFDKNFECNLERY